MDRMVSMSEACGIANCSALPLFPPVQNVEVTKHAAVATINRLVELIGLPVSDGTGCALYGATKRGTCKLAERIAACGKRMNCSVG